MIMVVVVMLIEVAVVEVACHSYGGGSGGVDGVVPSAFFGTIISPLL